MHPFNCRRRKVNVCGCEFCSYDGEILDLNGREREGDLSASLCTEQIRKVEINEPAGPTKMRDAYADALNPHGEGSGLHRIGLKQNHEAQTVKSI